MASVTITLELSDEPVDGHTLDKLAARYSPTAAAIVDRIGQANQASFPSHRYDPVDVLVKTIAAAVESAEATVIPE